jgi:hypothetical protein
MTYILETICILELESSPGLKEALLLTLVMNLTGLPGHHEECDYVNEFFNRLLEDIIKHKDARFDDTFLRDVISRNLRHLALLKKAWREKLGLKAKSGKHSDPHQDPELRILLDVYRKEELHKRRPFRDIDSRDTDDLGRGFQKLRESGISQFLKQSRRNDQGDVQEGCETAESTREDDIPFSVDDDDDEFPDMSTAFATSGSISVVDGGMVVDEIDALTAIRLADEIDEDHAADEAGDFACKFSVLDGNHDMSDGEEEAQ